MPNPVGGEEPYLLPISIPAPVSGILATGRTADRLLPIVSGSGTASTTGLAVVTATDGRTYLVDLARWAMASETTPLTGTGKTRVSTAKTIPGTSSAIGLRGLDGSAASAADATLAARIRVTPGFTPDDTWLLTWQGVLPGLQTRAAIFSGSGASRGLAVQIGTASPEAVADLTALGVADGDLVEIVATGGITTYCPSGAEVAVTGPPSGSSVTLTVAGGCLASVPDASSIPVVVTFRSKGLVLTGTKAGYAGRPEPDVELPVSGTRLFYVTDACAAGSECAAIRKAPPYALAFPLPTGPALGLAPAWVDAAGVPTAVQPSRGTAIQFTTASGLSPSGHHPIVSSSAVSSALPSGLGIADSGGAGAGVSVYVSYAAGMVIAFSSGAATGSMAVIR